MEVKGTAVEILPVFIKKKFGEQGFAKWLDHLSPEAREVFSGKVLQFNWHPLTSILTEPTQTLCDLFYSGNAQGAIEIGQFSAEHALTGVYKIFVKLRKPSFLIEKAGAILPTYFKPSSIDLILQEKGHSKIRIYNFAEPHIVIESRIKGWIEKAIEIAGGKDVVVSITASVLRGDASTEMDITYT